MRSYFITATGTDIGKTLVTCILAAQLKQQGISVRAIKPVISGWQELDSDTVNILKSQDIPVTEASINSISPWRFTAPLSPDMAAEREGRTLPFEEIVSFCNAPSPHDILLIEGAGGVMTPLGGGKTMRDLMAALPTEAVLVAGSYLGTLSHSLTAIEALNAANVPLKGVVVSESSSSPVPLAETVAALQGFCRVPVIALPRLKTAAQPYKTSLNIAEMLSMIGTRKPL